MVTTPSNSSFSPIIFQEVHSAGHFALPLLLAESNLPQEAAQRETKQRSSMKDINRGKRALARSLRYHCQYCDMSFYVSFQSIAVPIIDALFELTELVSFGAAHSEAFR
jgi:hypothetical protein